MIALASTLLIAGSAIGGDLAASSKPASRGQPLVFTYRPPLADTGMGEIIVEWRDSAGRIVQRRRLRQAVAGKSALAITLDPRRAVSLDNTLHVHLEIRKRAGDGTAAIAVDDAEAAFTVAPARPDWTDYHVIMWQPHGLPADLGLRRLGVDAGAVIANRDDRAGDPVSPQIEPLMQAGLGCYIENIATDFYSAYHRWSPDHPVNWRFTEAQRAYREDPLNPLALQREPSLSDMTWLGRITARLTRTVHEYAPYRPLYYSLGDETGIADLAAFWDFDLSPASLAGMRLWLQAQYGTLAALNREWGTAFPRWDLVMPMTTSAAIRRDDGNFSAWSDFKAWMDESFARALSRGTDAVHAADAEAVSAIEGGQPPGWGGYDYARLAPAVDLMELYDVDDNVEIARSFNPKLVLLATSSHAGPEESARLWHSLLRGGRGAILWDEADDIVHPDGAPGPRGLAMAPLFSEFRNGIATLIIDSTPTTDPVAILYSPASQRIQWLLDLKSRGGDWSARDASAEYGENAVRSATARFVRLLGNLGLQPHFVSAETIAQGGLARYRVLILPRTLALSASSATAIRRFVEAGGTLVADGEPGRFDDHGRALPQSLLADLLSGAPRETEVGAGRVFATDASEHQDADLENWSSVLNSAGILPLASIADTRGRPVAYVDLHTYREGATTLIAIERDAPGAVEPLRLRLARAYDIYDIRKHRFLQHGTVLDLDLAAEAPTILALSDGRRGQPVISAPRNAHPGDLLALRLGLAGVSKAVLRVEIAGPNGDVMPAYSTNYVVTGPGIAAYLPVAENDPIGDWTIRASDIVSGHTATARLTVRQRKPPPS